MSSRLERTRRQLATTRAAIAATAIVGFGGLVGFVRATHPATHHNSQRASQRASTDDDQSEFDYGSSAIAPSTDQPSFSTGSS